jgi:hypothetical protein
MEDFAPGCIVSGVVEPVVLGACVFCDGAPIVSAGFGFVSTLGAGFESPGACPGTVCAFWADAAPAAATSRMGRDRIRSDLIRIGFLQLVPSSGIVWIGRTARTEVSA